MSLGELLKQENTVNLGKKEIVIPKIPVSRALEITARQDRINDVVERELKKRAKIYVKRSGPTDRIARRRRYHSKENRRSSQMRRLPERRALDPFGSLPTRLKGALCSRCRSKRQ